MKKIISILSIVLVLSSCYSTKVMVNTTRTNGLPIDTLNLISTMLGPVYQPVLPLIDAGAFNAKTNKISDQILDEEQKIIENYKVILTKCLEEKLPVNVITGDGFSSEVANQYRVENSMQIDNKNFPVVFFSDGDMNIVDFDMCKDVNDIFKENKDLQLRIRKFTSDLKLKNVLISYNRLCVVNIGGFGFLGDIRLESYLYLYDSDGNLLMDAYVWAKPTTVSGKQISQYRFQLDNFHGLALLMSQELVNYIK